eukprot:CAMPEP_0194129274 /NCGR_PEP_ID=MMETSP0152-20130528/513_1 /TAXON_ID=1049557 /ORGANISM="Thalassiothrix antarctica, Strain L6-D1" /LENGTH=343 /DNA_ID=CAMNT_0038823411 /DNA_START=36 /DNA_END=1068 /DNA_ORIENTATION=-
MLTNKFEGILMGMGNPLLDISVDVNQEILDKYEVKLDSQILAEEKHMPLYKEIGDLDPKFIAGGATQNSIRVAQWILKEKMGKTTAFMGCVGNDDYGKKLDECATNDGVLVHYMKDESTSTGTCACLIKDGERALVANLAAANNFKPSHLETEKAKEIIESAKFYYIAGFFLTVSPDALKEVAEHAVANKKTLAINLSAEFIIDFFPEPLKMAIEYANYVFGNEVEAAAIGKKFEYGEDLVEIAKKVAALPCKNGSRTVIFTQGSKKTIVVNEGKVTEFDVEELPKEKLVDTNGAGDAFVGGFLSQLVQENSLEDCVKVGHWAAREIIQVSGTTLPENCPSTF